MRLIDADALDKLMGEAHLSLLKQYGSYDAFAMGYESAACAVEAAPTIDAVPVVRCKDCKHFHKSIAFSRGGVWCEHHGIDIDADDFCSYGERRSENV